MIEKIEIKRSILLIFGKIFINVGAIYCILVTNLSVWSKAFLVVICCFEMFFYLYRYVFRSFSVLIKEKEDWVLIGKNKRLSGLLVKAISNYFWITLYFEVDEKTIPVLIFKDAVSHESFRNLRSIKISD